MPALRTTRAPNKRIHPYKLGLLRRATKAAAAAVVLASIAGALRAVAAQRQAEKIAAQTDTGSARLRVTSGEYVPAGGFTAASDPSLNIQSLTFAMLDSGQTPPEPQLFDDSPPFGSNLAIQVEFTGPALRRGERMGLHLSQAGIPGFTKVSVDAQPVGCSAAGCTYQAQIPVISGAPAPGSLSAAVVLEAGGAHSKSPAKDLVWSLECDSDPGTVKPFCTEPTGSYEVSGKVEYYRRELVAKPGNDPHPKAPQYEYSGLSPSQKVPARELLVRLTDGCGLYTDTFTDAEGDYSIPFLSWCGEKDAKVTAYSLSGPGAGKQVALGLHTGNPVAQSYDELQDDPSQYTVISGEVGTFNPEQDAEDPGGLTLNRAFSYNAEGTLAEQGKFSRSGEVARAFTILGNAMKSLDYYRQLVDPDRLPQINIVLTDAFLVDEDNFNIYMPARSQMIYITPDSEWSFWAVAHETGHYFDGGILVEGGLTNYGRWGEPMANVRAGMIIGSSWMAAREGVAAENLDVQGTWDDMESEVLPPESLPLSGPGSGWVWRILWDLHDGGPETAEPLELGFGEFDQWNGGGGSDQPNQHLLNGVVMEYLPQLNGRFIPTTRTAASRGRMSWTCSTASPASTI
ncbi:MAG: hypothetical protein WD627_11190 [Actinomycetota bacterium]